MQLRNQRRLGMTLVEMLAAMAVTLILILALAQVFQIIGDNVADGRAIVEMSSAIRDTANRLQDDLDAITVPARPWPEPGSGLGYLEYLEGNGFDLAPDYTKWDSKNPVQAASILGDSDDVLAFTVRNTGQPFVGRLEGPENKFSTIRSNVAEIIWWLEPTDTNGNGRWDWDPVAGLKETFELRRRVLLVLPDQEIHPEILRRYSLPKQFHLTSDLSVRLENGRLVANSLADLTKRQNRAGHVAETGTGPAPNGFPYRIQPAMLEGSLAINGKSLMPRQAGNYLGEDIILSDVIGFDVKIFDPSVPLTTDPNNIELVAPGDPSFNAAGKVVGHGAFVDLGFARYQAGVPSLFGGRPHAKSQLNQFAYDTWSLDYEYDGFNQDGGKLDQGTNGLDDDTQNGVDDHGERETSPPYPHPMRGLQVIIRTLDPDSRQVRQITVTSDFTPE